MIDVFITGLILGGMYLLPALGLLLPFQVCKIPWFAHAIIIVWAGYIINFTTQLGLNLGLAILISIASCVILNILIERFALKYFYDIPGEIMLVAIFSIFIALQYLALAWWGPRPRVVPSILSMNISFGGVSFAGDRILIATMGIIAVMLLYIFLNKTRMGKAVRATSQDARTADILGINTSRIRTLVFVISGILAGIAGLLLGSRYMVDPFLTDFIILKLFIVVLLGGFGSVHGTLAGSYIVGISESFISNYVTTGWTDIILFFILIGFLTIRPEGIFGVKRRA